MFALTADRRTIGFVQFRVSVDIPYCSSSLTMCCRMFAHHNCQQDAYDNREGLHPNDQQDKNTMVNSINTSSVHSFMDTQASVDIAAQRLKDMAMASMETMLQSEPNVLLRLCWIYLPDFVIFEYDLPAACKEDKTLAATMQQTRK